MKLATLGNGRRDGRLAIVSADLRRACWAAGIADTMQAAMDDWEAVRPALARASQALNADPEAGHTFDFDPAQALAPLPRAYAWMDGSAYLSHLHLFRKVQGRTVPEEYFRIPLMYQGGSDILLGCRAALPCTEGWGADCEGEVAVVVGDVPARPTRQQALDAVRLITIVNDVSLRLLQPRERETGFGWVHCKPPTAFAPVLATPDELGDAWDGARLHGRLRVWINDTQLGEPDAGVGMQFDFAELIQHAAQTRDLGAGTIIGSGTVSNADADVVGVACIAERRFIEQLRDGKATTPWLREGDVVRLDMHDATGRTIFGDIVQRATEALSTQTP